MPLVAMLGEERVDATKHTAESWEEVRAASRRSEITMPLCGIRAVAKTRGERTRFFAHYTREGCRVDHGGETPQHEALKEAVARAIDAVPGWHADLEFPHPSREWVIDVLAQPEAASRRRIAFEVQLSSQSPEGYFARTDRYFRDGLFPVWLVPRELEPHRVAVPTVVTGFGKTSLLPDDPKELLHLEVEDRAGRSPIGGIWLEEFVRVLLTNGDEWPHGSPTEQRATLEAAERAAAENQRRQEQAASELRDRFEELNRLSAPASAAFGDHVVSAGGQAAVFATVTACYKCRQPMLVWAARSPGIDKVWPKVPTSPKLRIEFKDKRYENHPDVHRAVDAWIREVDADVKKALIQLRWTRAYGGAYSAFVCPHCDAVFGENFRCRIKDEKWSLIAVPEISPATTKLPPAQPSRDAIVAAQQSSIGRQPPGHAAGQRAEFEGRTSEQIESDLAATRAWLAKDRASYGIPPQELARREQARIDRALEVEAFRSNPQYIKHGGRHICRICGGLIDDEREGRHKDGSCAT